jgi:hypothetical protein
MSSLTGSPDSVWSLPKAVDAMAAAARQAGVPSGLWLAGFVYSGLSLGWTFGVTIAFPLLRATADSDWIESAMMLRPIGLPRLLIDPLEVVSRGQWPLLIILLFISFRLVAGLARLSPAETWKHERGQRRAPRLRQAWRMGKGVTRAAIGLWTQILMMMFGAALIFIGPVRLLVEFGNLEGDNPFTVLFTGASIALVLVYSFLLSVLFQIALHSLVQNRRGVGSALLHAWRIAKNDPLATTRAILIDSVLYLTVLSFHLLYYMVFQLNASGMGWPILIPAIVVEAFAGCTRCAYWARAYRALGGLSTTAEEAPTM